MSDTTDSAIVWNKILTALKSLRSEIAVPTTFQDQIIYIDELLANDYTGLVSTVVEFMIGSGTVDYQFEAESASLNKLFQDWKKTVNFGLSIDISKGLRSLTAQYLRERWRTSLIATNIRWKNVGGFLLPMQIWFSDGSQIYIEGDTSKLGQYKYFLGRDQKFQLKETENTTVLIRKPYNSWYEKNTTPYLVKKGVLYNSLLKRAIVTKQSDIIMAIVPYLLLVKSGNDTLAKLKELADEDSLLELKNELKKVINTYNERVKLGDIIGAFNYDVNLEHFMPDLSKAFNDNITKSVDKDILAGLGLIELEGFSSTRQEAILNPKMLVEEIKDAVLDWKEILDEITLRTLLKNQRLHPRLSQEDIQIIPGTIKAFLTDDMKALLRSAYDRGLISKQSEVETTTDLNFEVEVSRRKKEAIKNIDEIMYAPIILNQEGKGKDLSDPIEPPTLEEQNNERASKEFFKCEACSKIIYFDEINEGEFSRCPNCNHLFDLKIIKSTKNLEIAPYKNIDELPENVKNVLPIPAQIIWMKTFNEVYNKTKNEMQAIKIAWSVVKQKYEKKGNKWVKK